MKFAIFDVGEYEIPPATRLHLCELGAPRILRGIGVVSRQLSHAAKFVDDELIAVVARSLTHLAQDLSDYVDPAWVHALTPDYGLYRFSDPRFDRRHLHRGSHLSTAPIWSLLTVSAPRYFRAEWNAVRACVVSAALNLQRSMLDEGPQMPTADPFGPAQSAIEEACRALRKSAEVGASDLFGLKDIGSRDSIERLGMLGQRAVALGLRDQFAANRIKRIESFLSLAADRRGYGHGGTVGKRGPTRKAGADTPQGLTPPEALIDCPHACSNRHEVIGGALWEFDEAKHPGISIVSRLTTPLEQIQQLDGAPQEHVEEPIYLVSQECAAQEPVALVAAKAQSRVRVMARHAIHYRHALPELLDDERARVREVLLNPPAGRSHHLRAWFEGAVVALSGRVQSVHIGGSADQPCAERPILFSPENGHWRGYCPTPHYQLPYLDAQRNQSRPVTTSLPIPALNRLTLVAKALLQDSVLRDAPRPSQREILDLFGLTHRRRVSALAKPVRRAIRDFSGDGVNVGFLTGDMPRDGTTQAYYTTRSLRDLMALHMRATCGAWDLPLESFRGLDQLDHVHFGALRCPTDGSVASLCQGLFHRLSAARDRTDITDYHNSAATYVAVNSRRLAS